MFSLLVLVSTIFFIFSKHTEPVEGKEREVVAAEAPLVRIRTDVGMRSIVAYEDIKFWLRLNVAQNIVGDCVKVYIFHNIVLSRLDTLAYTGSATANGT